MNAKTERNYGLDITRIIAVLAVIMIHISVNYAATYDTSSIEFIFANIFGSIARMGVPLFVMVSGALMLDEGRRVEFKSSIIKKVKNIFLLLLFWSAVYCCIWRIVLPVLNGNEIKIYDIVDSLVLGHDHLWYLYMTMGLYLATPFIRAFAKKENKNQVLIFVLISLVVRFTLPLLSGLSLIWKDVSYCVKFIEKFDMGFFGGYVSYYLLGWYIVNFGIKHKWSIYLLGSVSLLGIILYAQMTKDLSNAYTPMSILVLLFSVAVFTFINSKTKTIKSDKTKTIIVRLSNLSFGVYAVHLICQMISGVILGVFISQSVTKMICSFLLTSILSFVASYIASKIPIIKRTVRM